MDIVVTLICCCGVPCIALLTKVDALKNPAFCQLKEEGLTYREAQSRIQDTAAQILNKLKENIESDLSMCKYPPKAYVSLACKLSGQLCNIIIDLMKYLNAAMHQHDTDCAELLRCTTDALDAVELQRLLISTQQTSIDLNIEYAARWGWFGR